jgi:hypothetical protein
VEYLKRNVLFEHWTDKDLYRAIENPEHAEADEAQEREIEEYVTELKARAAGAQADSEREARLRAKYSL